MWEFLLRFYFIIGMIKGLILSNKISDKNRDFMIFKSKNTLKLIVIRKNC